MTDTITATERDYGEAPPPWLDLDSIVPPELMETMEAGAYVYFKEVEPLLAKARALEVTMAEIESLVIAAVKTAAHEDSPPGQEDGLRHLLDRVTGLQDVWAMMQTFSELLHPDTLERDRLRRESAEEVGQ